MADQLRDGEVGLKAGDFHQTVGVQHEHRVLGQWHGYGRVGGGVVDAEQRSRLETQEFGMAVAVA